MIKFSKNDIFSIDLSIKTEEFGNYLKHIIFYNGKQAEFYTKKINKKS